MQELTYNVINGGNISMWRDIPATITITGVEDTTGTWKLLIDTDFIDGVVLKGNVSVDNNALVAVIEEVNTTELRNAIRGKKSIEAKVTLTNDTNQVYLFPITIKNRGMEGTPTPIQDYYTKTQTDNKFATKEVVNADVANLANNYWTKQETAAAIANVQTMDIIVVQQLPPVAQAHQYTIYLVPATDEEQSNVYNEYLVINGAFQLIGSTAVDLSQYANLSSNNTFAGNNTFTGTVQLPNSFYFNTQGRIWTVNNVFNVFLGTTTQTWLQNKTMQIGCSNTTGAAIYVICPTDYIYYNNHQKNTAGGFCISDETTGDLTLPGVLVSKGQKINTLSTTSFTPVDNQVYKYTLADNTSFTIDTTALTANNQINFELHLTQGATAYTPSFTNTIIWGDGDVFDSSNNMPPMTDANTVYALVFRWDGEDLLCNVAYTKKVVAQ